MNTFEADAIQACKKGDVNLITEIMTNSYSSLITNNNDRYGYRNNTHNDWNNGADENSRCPLLTRETQIKCRHMLDMPIRQLNQHRLQSAVERKNVQDIIECTIDIKKLYFHTYTNLNDFNLDRLSILRNIPNNNNDANGSSSSTLYTRTSEAWNSVLDAGRSIYTSATPRTPDLYHTCIPIQISLTNTLNGTDVDVAIKMFKNVLGCMNDRNYTYPETLVSIQSNAGAM